MLLLIIGLYIFGIGLAGYGKLMITMNGLKDTESNQKYMPLILYGILVMFLATIITVVKYT